MEEIRAPETAPLSETGVQCFPCNNSYIISLSFHFSGNIIILLIILRVISWNWSVFCNSGTSGRGCRVQEQTAMVACHFCCDPASKATAGTGPEPTEHRDRGQTSNPATVDVIWDLDTWALSPLTSVPNPASWAHSSTSAEYEGWHRQHHEIFMSQKRIFSFPGEVRSLSHARPPFLSMSTFCVCCVVSVWLHLSFTFIDLSA